MSLEITASGGRLCTYRAARAIVRLAGNAGAGGRGDTLDAQLRCVFKDVVGANEVVLEILLPLRAAVCSDDQTVNWSKRRVEIEEDRSQVDHSAAAGHGVPDVVEL